MQTFDDVIVGAGAAGCVLAHRLSQDAGRRVLLLEAGPEDRHPLIHMPKGIGKIRSSSKYVWPYDAFRDPDDAIGSSWMRGRALGGSSSINGMVYVRGQPADYDDLAAVTSSDWCWDRMREAFDALENREEAASQASARLNVTTHCPDSGESKLLRAIIAAGQSIGLAYDEDVNRPDDKVKIGYVQRTIHRGRRQSASVAFLRPVRQRPNLVVRTGVHVDHVIFDKGVAVGVECREGGTTRRFHGRRIVLSAGTLATPAILQRSGVGAADLLSTLGIPVIVDLPQVGENLREHTCLNLQWRAVGHSNNPRYRGAGALLSGLQYYLSRSGPLSTAISEVNAVFKSRPDLARPDAQLFFGPHSFIDGYSKGRTPEKEHGFMMCVYPVRPRSQGRVHITSADAAVLPRVEYDPFSDEEDRRQMVDAVRFARRLASAEPLCRFTVAETRPGGACLDDDQILDAYQRLGGPVYHAVGTCRMGVDAGSVVDPMTRVRGVESLHVVDLSIAPFVPSAATYGPTLGLAWRAADLLIAADRGA
jgi:choline dehydrogenase